jgi:hypothetical protein
MRLTHSRSRSFGEEKNLASLLVNEPRCRFLGRPDHSLTTVPTELALHLVQEFYSIYK